MMQGRFVPNGIPHHIGQRVTAGRVAFFADEDYHFYLQCLGEAARSHACRIHAYVLMPDHVQLVATPRTRAGFAGMMQTVRDLYTEHMKRAYRRSNALWESRFQASLVQPERYLLACYRYIESSPVRAGIVQHAANYRWSSHAHHALGVKHDLITEHLQYRQLGATPGERYQTYREIMREPLPPEMIAAIRTALEEERVLGDEGFRQRVAKATRGGVTIGAGTNPVAAEAIGGRGRAR